jgi:pimeloyl-ACP methyl ester carboxylesterase
VPYANTGAVSLYYEVEGEGEPLVLIMGIGSQMVSWPEDFRARLVAAGFQLILFDNRDVGLSTRLDHLGTPDPREVIVRGVAGLGVDAPYLLEDMAQDCADLLDHLGLDMAHILGISLGGMIAQTMAIHHPDRCRSLISIMSSTGSRLHALGSPKAIASLLRPPPRTREEAGMAAVEFFRVVGSPAYAHDEAGIRRRSMLAFDRGVSPGGFCRHLAAMVASGNRIPQLRRLRVPSLVIHGSDDSLLPHRGGAATAAAIPSAEFVSIAGMGHDLPAAVQDRIVEAVLLLVQRVRQVGSGKA